jgi:hypothetical protein
MQITCLYDMDIPRPDNFNETYLYEGKTSGSTYLANANLMQNSWNAISQQSSDPANPSPTPISNPLSTKSSAA